jgi:phosphatidylglycerol---prolipoprotein diacylglyceryl transferase
VIAVSPQIRAVRRIHPYTVFLGVGIYVGTVATAVLADRSGFSPLAAGLGATACALAGLAGARLYHLVLRRTPFERRGESGSNPRGGGLALFGAVPTFVPASVVVAHLLHYPTAVFLDLLSVGVLAGGFWIRLGCALTGCCGGRETEGPLGVWLHDVRGVVKRRIPVQFLEMAWWLVGLNAFFVLWPSGLPEGGYALGVLGWYGVGRFFLEPLRERPEVLFGAVRINQVVAGTMALCAGGALAMGA